MSDSQILPDLAARLPRRAPLGRAVQDEEDGQRSQQAAPVLEHPVGPERLAEGLG